MLEAFVELVMLFAILLVGMFVGWHMCATYYTEGPGKADIIRKYKNG
jgi:hypothetical protein